MAQHFERTKFKGERLENRNFTGCWFYQCRFEDAVFVGCDFSDSSFVESAPDWAIFEQGNFRNCAFDRCDFIGSKFIGCNFDHVRFAEEADVQRDIERILAGWIKETPGLIATLKNGHFDGSGHDGDCVDLMATLHRIRNSKYKLAFKESPSAAELWLLSIAQRDMSSDPTPAGYATARVVELAEAILQPRVRNCGF